MAENDGSKKKKWLNKDTLEITVKILTGISISIGLVGGAYKLWQGEKETRSDKPPVINITLDSSHIPRMQHKNIEEKPLTKQVEKKDSVLIKNNEVSVLANPVAVESNKGGKKEIETVKNEPIKKEMPEIEEVDDFGMIVNNSKSGNETKRSEKKVKAFYYLCSVLGNYPVGNGNIIKVRLLEDATINSIHFTSNTQFTGKMTVNGTHVTIDFTNTELEEHLHAADKEKNIGLPFQDKYLDGFKMYLTNK